jgi:hypothetical protein
MHHSISAKEIEHRIYLIRDQKVMLDKDIAEIYGIATKRLNEQVKRNRHRFPGDFMFQLTEEESDELIRSQNVTLNLKSQIVTSNEPVLMRSQFATGSKRNVRYLPYVFTEHGAVMLACNRQKRNMINEKQDLKAAFHISFLSSRF